ncbi:uncharacterized protein EV420DRAFT_1641610 [Desarmillaria tabescens]|uniref:Uncharacterized protein n=1 Tax=Armillaria tabescens TaxID=1929756 RepID=A0AA39KGB0_ARMTA|nr:uncharacterized protein EV420DRAFT_1641610 [Desarmillaria tabescens]KAK0460268.1 hypothetical protein EV420DRAFT_1641610 [Desarmillaria tabescens]
MEAPSSDLSQNDRDVHLNALNLSLNTLILQALLHGLYTGIVAVTLWIIFSSPRQLRSTLLRIIILTLYVVLTILFGINWAFERYAFIEHGDNYYTVFTALINPGPWWRAYTLTSGISGGISTLLVDITIIWRCWTLWDRQWRVVLVPIFCAVAGTTMKIMAILSTFRNLTDGISKHGQFAADIDWSLIYIMLTLATNFTCTFLIIYRIVRHAQGISASRKIVEILIESSAMYSFSLIIYLALVSKNSEAAYYADIIAAYVKAVVPTLLVGRVSAYANTISQRQKMVAMWENHHPLTMGIKCCRDCRARKLYDLRVGSVTNRDFAWDSADVSV